MALVGGSLWLQERSDAESRNMVSHTYEVIGHIETLMSTLAESQLGSRSFIISGSEDSLEPYFEALRDAPVIDRSIRSLQQHRSIAQELALIKELTIDNPVQQSNLDELSGVVTQLLDHTAELIQAKRDAIANNTAQEFDVLRSKSLMDRVRALVRIMEAEESHPGGTWFPRRCASCHRPPRP